MKPAGGARNNHGRLDRSERPTLLGPFFMQKTSGGTTARTMLGEPITVIGRSVRRPALRSGPNAPLRDRVHCVRFFLPDCDSNREQTNGFPMIDCDGGGLCRS